MPIRHLAQLVAVPATVSKLTRIARAVAPASEACSFLLGAATAYRPGPVSARHSLELGHPRPGKTVLSVHRAWSCAQTPWLYRHADDYNEVVFAESGSGMSLLLSDAIRRKLPLPDEAYRNTSVVSSAARVDAIPRAAWVAVAKLNRRRGSASPLSLLG